MITTNKINRAFIKIEVKDNNVEQAIRVLKETSKKVFQSDEDESTYEKPSEKKTYRRKI